MHPCQNKLGPVQCISLKCHEAQLSWDLKRMHCTGPNLFWHGCNEFHFKTPTDFRSMTNCGWSYRKVQKMKKVSSDFGLILNIAKGIRVTRFQFCYRLGLLQYSDYIEIYQSCLSAFLTFASKSCRPLLWYPYTFNF